MRPAHHEPKRLQGAIDVIITNGMIGGIKGGILGLACAAAAHRYWPAYNRIARQFKVFIQVGFIIFGGCWKVDRALIQYERQIRMEHLMEQQAKMEAAVEQGVAFDLTGRRV